MPHAHPSIAKLFSHDGEAWMLLRGKGWTEDGFILKKPTPDYEPSDSEWEAVTYLCDEWDWAFEG